MIERVGATGLPRAGAAKPSAIRGGFTAEAGRAAPADDVRTVGALSMDGLLALQDEGEPAADREARRHGHDMLTALAEVQRELLGGELGPERLQRLAALATDLPLAADPALRSVLASIALRARLELCRRGTDLEKS